MTEHSYLNKTNQTIFYIEDKLLKNKSILPSYKLIYLYLQSLANFKTKTTNMSFNDLTGKMPYTRTTIMKAVASLEKNKAINICKPISGSHIYDFKKPTEACQVATFSFINSKKLSVKEKEFLLLILPYVSNVWTIGEYMSPATIPVIAKLTGLTYTTTKKRIDSLEAKGLISKTFFIINMYGDEEFCGYRFDLEAIMLDKDVR